MPAQLPTDYKTVTSIITPEKKASIMHNVSNLFIVIFQAYFVERSNLVLFMFLHTVFSLFFFPNLTDLVG